MFNNAKRPFYKSCKQLQFPKLGPDFTTWIIARFNQASVKADTASIDFLRAKVADTPNYVQEAYFQLVSHGVKEVRVKDVEEILDIISTQASYSFDDPMFQIWLNKKLKIN